MKTFVLDQFEGPLDLLLSLIAEQKLTISEVAISKVTEQYLQYLDQLEEQHPEEMADFLVVAAKLLYSKSRALMPMFGPEEDEGPTLEQQLRLYKAYVDASKGMHDRWLDAHRTAFREEPPRKADGFTPPENVTTAALKDAMETVVKRLTPLKPLPQAQMDKAISLKEKVDHIRSYLKQRKQFRFRDVVGASQNKTEVIIGFLALLELMKQRQVSLDQPDTFGDIMIHRV